MIKQFVKYSLLVNLVVLSLFVIHGCSFKASGGGGNKAYSLGEYSKAAGIYKKAFPKEKNKYLKGEIAFYMGESHRRINQPTKAAAAYSRSLRSGFDNADLRSYYAQSLLKSGKTEDALTQFEKVLEKTPSDAKAHAGIASIKVIEKSEVAPRCEIDKFKELNSKFSDYSAVYIGGTDPQIFFSSMRNIGKKKRLNKVTGQGSSDIYTIYKDAKGRWIKPEILEDPISTHFDEGALSVSFDGKELYFTRCRFDETKAINAEIYCTKRAGGRWSDPVLVPIWGDSIMVAHPCISPDGLTLYFVSDMPGGAGGKDIWKVQRTDASSDWLAPVNLGSPVNTPGDEMFPTIKQDSTFFFSSDGHPGYGGLDIFKVVKEEGRPDKVVNLLKPINSLGDDFGLVFEGNSESGLFSSSRDNVKGIDNVFTFRYRPVLLQFKGMITNQDKKSVPKGAFVRVVGSDGTMQKPEVKGDGGFTINIKANVDYVFMCSAPGYLNHREKFSTVGIGEDKVFEFNIALDKDSVVRQ